MKAILRKLGSIGMARPSAPLVRDRQFIAMMEVTCPKNLTTWERNRPGAVTTYNSFKHSELIEITQDSINRFFKLIKKYTNCWFVVISAKAATHLIAVIKRIIFDGNANNIVVLLAKKLVEVIAFYMD